MAYNGPDKIIEILDALASLRPNCEFYVYDNDFDQIHYHPDNSLPEPSKAEIEAEIERLKAEWTAQEYARNRETEYPFIGDQLDALYHAGVFPADMAAKIKKVKDDNPKG